MVAAGSARAWIGWEPLIVELVTASTFVAFALKFDVVDHRSPLCAGSAALVAQTAIDLHTKRLPREVTYTAIAIGFPLLVVASS